MAADRTMGGAKGGEVNIAEEGEGPPGGAGVGAFDQAEERADVLVVQRIVSERMVTAAEEPVGARSRQVPTAVARPVATSAHAPMPERGSRWFLLVWREAVVFGAQRLRRSRVS